MVQAQVPEVGARRELPENRSLRNSIRYSGRKASRAKSELRRLEILEATLRIAARDGLRGIKHRAVAREAGVPLAATTYYFRDIHELISDSFMLLPKRRGTTWMDSTTPFTWFSTPSLSKPFAVAGLSGRNWLHVLP